MSIEVRVQSQTQSGIGASSVPVVAFVADDHYAMPLAAAISSVVANLDRERGLQIFIVDGGISRTKKEKIMQSEDREWVRIEWLKPSKSHCDLLKSLLSNDSMTISNRKIFPSRQDLSDLLLHSQGLNQKLGRNVKCCSHSP